ncbi:hypothetical protein MCOR03_001684 [Pyricularia oryzae]|nr:hypothetical protein MCOR01_007396 [Pyricularia oryzae]KAI6340975.1 hypothetical protein MCOR28_006235 [Pyricularia oryzae]KAI6348770.1 hypothetical protein MCOR30_000042 [Pyricularia oryzae]KAI6413924.1 hypothetical protein MCOR24_006454 [Pyricularia oryzae]KAI6437411.1 hypothetical protein MCOR21_000471 [Pyricularia oryzae]
MMAPSLVFEAALCDTILLKTTQPEGWLYIPYPTSASSRHACRWCVFGSVKGEKTTQPPPPETRYMGEQLPRQLEIYLSLLANTCIDDGYNQVLHDVKKPGPMTSLAPAVPVCGSTRLYQESQGALVTSAP